MVAAAQEQSMDAMHNKTMNFKLLMLHLL